jgi:CheY-like chemotaxis protein
VLSVEQHGNEGALQLDNSQGVGAVTRQICHVLVVEDDRGIRTLIRAALKDEGYTVQVAVHGRAALELLEQYLPKLILLDMMMPVMDGSTFHQMLQADARHRDIPIVLMSAAHNLQLLAGAPRVMALLPKPFQLNTLLHVVEQQIGRP